MPKSARGVKWKILNRDKSKDVIDILLSNRGLNTKKQKEEFLNPKAPGKISLKEFKVSEIQIKLALRRIKKAIKKKEKIIIYGDYDADGICATAILWEALFKLNADVLPYIPERFSEGYGLNKESVQSLKSKYEDLSLIITVDNGIVANQAVKTANKLGIDVIITDHHQKGKVAPKAFAIIHTTLTSGAGLAWLLGRELEVKSGQDLAAIGVIADQIPLLGINRSLVKWGLVELNKTKRLGLLAMFKEAGAKPGEISPYTVGFIIAPRINAMGRLSHGLDSLRLLCTKNAARAYEIAHTVGKTNKERQRIVDNVISHARGMVIAGRGTGAIVVTSETYHEGVIGLVASKLVEEFYRPAIVISRQDVISKASARSIPGVNIFQMVSEVGNLLVNGGGHEMAAGFSLKTQDLDRFVERIGELSKTYLTDDLLKKTLKIDTVLNFDQIDKKLYSLLIQFEPTGMGNPAPTFASKKVRVIEARLVGSDRRHLKLQLRQDGFQFGAICFGMGENYPQISNAKEVDIVYSIELNNWNGGSMLEFNVRDVILL